MVVIIQWYISPVISQIMKNTQNRIANINLRRPSRASLFGGWKTNPHGSSTSEATLVYSRVFAFFFMSTMPSFNSLQIHSKTERCKWSVRVHWSKHCMRALVSKIWNFSVVSTNPHRVCIYCMVRCANSSLSERKPLLTRFLLKNTLLWFVKIKFNQAGFTGWHIKSFYTSV